MKHHQEHRSWSTCREQPLFAVFEIYSFLSKHPSRKKCSFSDLCIFCLLSSTKSVPMYLVTCWKYKQSHIFILPCWDDPSQLQNCRTKRFFMVFGTLRVTWRQRKEILFSAHPKTEYVLSLLCKFDRFIRFDTWGTAPLQRLCRNMVRTWYSAMKLYMICFLLCLFCRAFSLEKSQEALNEICALLHIHVKPLQLKAKQPLKWRVVTF